MKILLFLAFWAVHYGLITLCQVYDIQTALVYLLGAIAVTIQLAISKEFE